VTAGESDEVSKTTASSTKNDFSTTILLIRLERDKLG
jgi:hypothetical protein